MKVLCRGALRPEPRVPPASRPAANHQGSLSRGLLGICCRGGVRREGILWRSFENNSIPPIPALPRRRQELFTSTLSPVSLESLLSPVSLQFISLFRCEHTKYRTQYKTTTHHFLLVPHPKRERTYTLMEATAWRTSQWQYLVPVCECMYLA